MSTSIEQAVYGAHGGGGYRFLAESPGFSGSWLADEAQRLCTAFGERPAGVTCPFAVFAQPFGPRHVAVIQAADQGSDDAGRPGALAFRVLVVPVPLYRGLDADPFLISDRFPPDWQARGIVPPLEWDGGPPPPRRVALVRKILDVAPERTALLLGGVQTLVDGGRLVLVRPAPEPGLIRDLWTLLPSSSRAEQWPATYAFGNRLGFHLLATPSAAGPEFEHYIGEQAAGDYPEGRYEYALQHAAETSDQGELDALLSRRSRRQTLRLAVVLLAGMALAAFVLRSPLLDFGPPPQPKPLPAPAAAEQPLKLPPTDAFAPLTAAERAAFAARLGTLAKAVGAEAPAGDDDAALSATVAAVDHRIDTRAGERRPTRRPGADAATGPPQRRLRALLWKHGDAGYAEPGLNPVELVERLHGRLAQAGWIEEKPGD